MIGAAGHIDHGEIALVKALTGTDAGCLPEERAGGVAVDLGFVDVPGHERLVRTMPLAPTELPVVARSIVHQASDQGIHGGNIQLNIQNIRYYVLDIALHKYKNAISIQ